MYTVRVKIEVVNEDGEVVNHKGYPKHSNMASFIGLETTQVLKQYEEVRDAHAAMNTTFDIIKNLGAL